MCRIYNVFALRPGGRNWAFRLGYTQPAIFGAGGMIMVQENPVNLRVWFDYT